MHIETTTRCTLTCPGCPRTQIANKLGYFHKQDLVLDDLVKFLDCEDGTKVDRFLLEGNHGDPIYYNGLFDLIDQFRNQVRFTIVTNGSYKDTKFWSNLCSRLTDQDWIIFSIDGLEHNNHVYRRNSDWESTINGVQTVSKYSVNLGWKTLVFGYNYQELDQIQSVAESYGAKFVSERTGRFGDDSLKPPDRMVETQVMYTLDTKLITEISPQCQDHEKEYISADGYYWPCCWVSSAFTLYKSDLWKNRAQWSIKNNNLTELRKRLNSWIGDMQDDPDIVCKMMCKVGNQKAPKNHGLT